MYLKGIFARFLKRELRQLTQFLRKEYKAKQCFIGCIRKNTYDNDLVKRFTKLIFGGAVYAKILTKQCGANLHVGNRCHLLCLRNQIIKICHNKLITPKYSVNLTKYTTKLYVWQIFCCMSVKFLQVCRFKCIIIYYIF